MKHFYDNLLKLWKFVPLVLVKSLFSMKTSCFSVFNQISLKFLRTAFVLTLLSIRITVCSIECCLSVTDKGQGQHLKVLVVEGGVKGTALVSPEHCMPAASRQELSPVVRPKVGAFSQAGLTLLTSDLGNLLGAAFFLLCFPVVVVSVQWGWLHGKGV